jgi:gamma-glutamyl-gamma-aminobutyrate hydrolase PuuD
MAKTMSWGMTALPSFRDLKVFICPGPGFGQVAALFCQAGAKKAKGYGNADLVVFLGGSDVNPKLYGQEAIPEVVSWDDGRDAREKGIFEFCESNGIAMFGICRGAQFLHVMNGGTLWQHVDNHVGHHLIYDIEDDVTVRASSTHHQMMKYNDEMALLAITDEAVSSFVKDEEGKFDTDTDSIIEVEACFYENSKSLCIQGHPEYGPAEFTSWSFHKLHELINCDWMSDSPDEVLKAIS